MSETPPLWNVKFTRKAEDQYEKLKRSGKKPSINDLINLLVKWLRKGHIELTGPITSH